MRIHNYTNNIKEVGYISSSCVLKQDTHTHTTIFVAVTTPQRKTPILHKYTQKNFVISTSGLKMENPKTKLLPPVQLNYSQLLSLILVHVFLSYYVPTPRRLFFQEPILTRINSWL